MRDNLHLEASRYEGDMHDDEQDSPVVMWSIALGAPLFIIACIYGARWMFL